MGLSLLLVLLIAAASAQRGQKIASLPSWQSAQPLPNMESGYINLNVQDQKALFYVLVRTTSPDPAAPLFFWFQGGPGCSGLFALFSEAGPLRATANGGVTENSVGWMDFANVVYLEQPAGVGFSYSNSSEGYNTNDEVAAENNYLFVQNFLLAYPEFKGRATYLTGESYGGIYVPMLTAKILGNSSTQIYSQFSGLMEGNPVFNCDSNNVNTNIQIELFYWHGLVAYENYANWVSNGCQKDSSSETCSNIGNTIETEIGVIDQQLAISSPPQQPSLDPDSLYQDFCIGNGTLDYVNSIPINCHPTGNNIQTYLQRTDVQNAINVVQGLAPAKWAACSSVVNYSSDGPNMVPLFQKFHSQKPGIKVLVYSGDVDIATVPFATTQPCVQNIGSKRLTKWGPWTVHGNTAGYFEQFEHYTYATIKGGGHETPLYQPLSSYEMVKRFVSSGTLTDPSSPVVRKQLRKPSRSAVTQGQRLREFQKSQRTK